MKISDAMHRQADWASANTTVSDVSHAVSREVSGELFRAVAEHHP